MSDRDTDGHGPDPGLALQTVRSVPPAFVLKRDAEMDTIGWAIFLGLLVLLVPLLPFIIITLLISKAVKFIERQVA